MLRTRLLTVIILVPVVLWLILEGGWPLFLAVAGLLTAAEIEFCSLVGERDFQGVYLAGVALVWLCLTAVRLRHWDLRHYNLGLSGILLISLSWQAMHYPKSGITEWAVTIASGLYVGICGATLISLRGIPEGGMWWTLITVSVIQVADSAAFVVGSRWGRRKLASQLSPDKSVEGYVSGVVSGALTGALLGWVAEVGTSLGSSITWPRGMALGVLIAALAPMGDLVVSMVKREAGAKDSGQLFPGHGGALDRLDSTLFAAVIGYAYVMWLLR